jgi:hypothetical protein
MKGEASTLGCEHLGDVVLNGCNVAMEGPLFTPAPNGIGAGLILNQVGAAPDFNGTNFFTSAGGTIGPITINATSALPVPGYEARFGHATQPGALFTLNGAFSAAECNLNGTPKQASVVLAGGAALTQITPLNPIEFSSAVRPLAASAYPGQMHFDPTINEGAGGPIWWTGAIWINALGVAV